MNKSTSAYPKSKHQIYLYLSLLALSLQPCFGEDSEHYLSVVPGNVIKSPAKQANAVAATAAKKTASTAIAAPAAAKTSPDSSAQEQNPDAAATEGTAEPVVAAKTFYSAALEQAVKAYKTAPSAQAYSQILAGLRSCLAAQSGLRLSPVLLIKDNPYLSDFKPRVLEANGIRLWTFPKATERNKALLQWFDVHQTVVGVGRHKKVVNSVSVRFQDIALSKDLNIKDAGMVSIKDSGRRLILAGDAEDGSLALIAYKLGEGGWVEESDFNTQLPSFLTNNVSGRVGFRGNDLIFNVGKMIATTDANGNKRLLPEAESATYKFWLRNTDTGFQVATSIPDEDAFSVVYQFMQALAQGRTDVEKSCVADPKSASALVSLPKYLGLQGRSLDSSSKVVEMSLPAGKGSRFRLINIGKDDLIFDVGKFKTGWQIKAIFIAPPDPYLAETARYYPSYTKFEQKAEAPKDASAPAGVTTPLVKKK